MEAKCLTVLINLADKTLMIMTAESKYGFHKE